MIEKGKYGCKYGINCTKRSYKEEYINEYYTMKKLLDQFNLHELMKWSMSRTIYKNFLLEHTAYVKYTDYRKLPQPVQLHLKEYIINRLSVSEPTSILYKSALEFFNKMNRVSNYDISTFANANGNDGGGKSNGAWGNDYRYHRTGMKGEECQGLARNNFKHFCTHLQEQVSNEKNWGNVKQIRKCLTCNKWFCIRNTKEELRKVYNHCRNFDYTWRGEKYTGSSKQGAKSDYDFNQWVLYIEGKRTDSNKNTGKDANEGKDGNNPGDGKTPVKGVDPEDGGGITGGTNSSSSSSSSGGGGSTGGDTGSSATPLSDRGFYGVSEYQEGNNKDKELIVRFTEWTEDAIKTAGVLAGKFTDAFGVAKDAVSEYVKDNFIPGRGQKSNIMGLPLFYNPLCDPGGRVFSENTLMDLPLVYLMPGKGIVNPANKDDLGDAVEKYLNDYQSSDFSSAIRNLKGVKDVRALAFEPCFEEYLDYLNNLASIVWGLMGLDGIFKWNDELGMAVWELDPKQRALVYFAHSSTTASDSFSNTFQDGQLKGMVDTASSFVREYKQYAGKDLSESVFGFLGGSTTENGAAEGESDNTSAEQAVNASEGTIDSLLNNIKLGVTRVLNGTNLLFPQIWSDSQFERSYNLTFRFYSPYGSKESIFANVYFPLLTLLCMAMPRMDNISGYAQPFYVRLNVPGYMQIDMGVIQSLTIERGGDDKLWTVDGLPNELEVTITVQDMYSTLSITKNSAIMAFNAGLTGYLDCMAGIRTDDLLNMNRFGGILKNKMSKVYKSGHTGAGLWINESWQSFLNNLLS